MPLYDYACSSCGQIFEKSLPISTNQADVRCPSGQRQVRRLYFAPTVLFKGSGFYVTDHRSSPPAGENKP